MVYLAVTSVGGLFHGDNPQTNCETDTGFLPPRDVVRSGRFRFNDRQSLLEATDNGETLTIRVLNPASDASDVLIIDASLDSIDVIGLRPGDESLRREYGVEGGQATLSQLGLRARDLLTFAPQIGDFDDDGFDEIAFLSWHVSEHDGEARRTYGLGPLLTVVQVDAQDVGAPISAFAICSPSFGIVRVRGRETDVDPSHLCAVGPLFDGSAAYADAPLNLIERYVDQALVAPIAGCEDGAGPWCGDDILFTGLAREPLAEGDIASSVHLQAVELQVDAETRAFVRMRSWRTYYAEDLSIAQLDALRRDGVVDYRPEGYKRLIYPPAVFVVAGEAELDEAARRPHNLALPLLTGLVEDDVQTSPIRITTYLAPIFAPPVIATAHQDFQAHYRLAPQQDEFGRVDLFADGSVRLARQTLGALYIGQQRRCRLLTAGEEGRALDSLPFGLECAIRSPRRLTEDNFDAVMMGEDEVNSPVLFPWFYLENGSRIADRFRPVRIDRRRGLGLVSLFLNDAVGPDRAPGSVESIVIDERSGIGVAIEPESPSGGPSSADDEGGLDDRAGQDRDTDREPSRSAQTHLQPPAPFFEARESDWLVHYLWVPQAVGSFGPNGEAGFIMLRPRGLGCPGAADAAESWTYQGCSPDDLLDRLEVEVVRLWRAEFPATVSNGLGVWRAESFSCRLHKEDPGDPVRTARALTVAPIDLQPGRSSVAYARRAASGSIEYAVVQTLPYGGLGATAFGGADPTECRHLGDWTAFRSPPVADRPRL